MPRVVALMSGGLDSAVMACLLHGEGAHVYPLHISYGQLAAPRELAACTRLVKRLGIHPLRVLDISAYGQLHPSGLTDRSLPIVAAAFLPGRNLSFLLFGAVYAMTVGANAVALGLLDEATALFGDQRTEFLRSAETTLSLALGEEIRVLTPLRELSKEQVVSIASELGISGTYSCHSGGAVPCGACISCQEFGERL